MERLGGILDRLAADLNDAEAGHEFTSWTRDQLRGYLIEACQVITQARPEFFMQDRLLELTGCQDYYEVCGCQKITEDGVLGQADSSGHIFHTIKPRPDGAAGRWPGRACPPGSPFKVREFSVTADGRFLRLYPGIPPRQTVYIAVRCAVLPEDDGSFLPGAVIPAAVQYVLFRAKMVDGENNPAVLTAAVRHWAVFAALTGIKDSSLVSRTRTAAANDSV